ncbi:MAG: alpha/beta fold hydrolase [Granulosicoccaceae bacterium]
MINAVVAGRGEPLLILHGLFGSLDNYRSIALHFERHHQVHRIDLPGHGNSDTLSKLSISAMADEIQRYLEQNKIERCSVIGHSLGGKVAMALANNDTQQRISKLIIVDIAPRLYPPHHQELLDALSSLDLNTVIDRRDADKLLRATIAEAGVRAFLLKSLIRDADKALRWQFDLNGINANYTSIREMPTMAKAIAIPTLFIKGSKSDYIREADAELIKRHFSQVTLKEIPGAGHWVHAEKPAVFSRLCTEFLQHSNS